MRTMVKALKTGLWLVLVAIAMTGCMGTHGGKGFGPRGPVTPPVASQPPPVVEPPEGETLQAEGGSAVAELRQLNPDIPPRDLLPLMPPPTAAEVAELRRLVAEMQKTLGDHGRRIKDLEAWRQEVTGQILRLGDLLQRLGKTEANIANLLGTSRKGSLLLNLGNITIWEFAWTTGRDGKPTVIQAHAKKYHEVKALLGSGTEDLVSIVALCDPKKACDGSIQHADIMASSTWLNRPGTVQKQPGRGKETANTIVITVKRK